MSFLLTSAIVACVAAAMPVAGVLLCRRAVQSRETTQAQLSAQVSHLQPRRSWSVAYAGLAHMESLFKFWSWEDVGVLHMYEEAVAFYGEYHDFEVSREEVAEVRLTTYARTNPLVPWIEIETTGGVRYFFCLPEGMHVFGMRQRAEAVHAALRGWARGTAARPLRIG